MLPDLYGGRTADTVETAETLQRQMDQEAAVRLLEECADQLAQEGRRWAAMGFSMGAFLACHLAGRGPAGPQELVLFYGGQPPTGNDVRTSLVSLHVVADDEYFTEEELNATERGFRDHGAIVQTYRYTACGHWFAERDSPGFDQAAADVARDRVVGLLGR
jgi:carboxymethylenebutenolidase